MTTPAETPLTYEFMAGVVPPSSSPTFTLRFPHELGPFRPTSLNIDADVAAHLTIETIQVGANEQLASPSCVPASLFSPQHVEDDLYFDLVPSSRILSITVRNHLKEPKTFRCEVTGRHNFDRIGQAGHGCALGLGWNIVEPGKTIVLRVQPQLVLAPNRLHLPAEVLEHFTICSAEKHSTSNLKSSTDAVSPEKLAKENLAAGGRGFCLEPNVVLSPSHYLTIVVTNDSGSSRPFTGAVVGKLLA